MFKQEYVLAYSQNTCNHVIRTHYFNIEIYWFKKWDLTIKMSQNIRYPNNLKKITIWKKQGLHAKQQMWNAEQL